jgi:preprotein translocase subunit SecF
MGKLTSMTITGDFAEAFMVVLCVSYLFLVIEFLIIEETALAVFMILGFMIPLSILIYDYIKNNRDKKTSEKFCIARM